MNKTNTGTDFNEIGNLYSGIAKENFVLSESVDMSVRDIANYRMCDGTKNNLIEEATYNFNKSKEDKCSDDECEEDETVEEGWFDNFKAKQSVRKSDREEQAATKKAEKLAARNVQIGKQINALKERYKMKFEGVLESLGKDLSSLRGNGGGNAISKDQASDIASEIYNIVSAALDSNVKEEPVPNKPSPAPESNPAPNPKRKKVVRTPRGKAPIQSELNITDELGS